jgi:alpha-D-ribose 1-methylphosphonate 5-triphosphate diphosphatase
MKIHQQQNGYIIVNAKVVTPERILCPGAVRIESGLITDIYQGPTAGRGSCPHDTLDAKGCLLLPGFVDIHADSLEMAIAPRPAAPFVPATILPTYDAELAVHGITTVFHCVGLADLGDIAKPSRTRSNAVKIVTAIRSFMPQALLRTRIHLRYEITDTASLPLVHQMVEKHHVDLVSIMDHTPGYGVFKDIEAYRQYYRRSGQPEQAADSKFAELNELRSKVDEQTLIDLVRSCHQHHLTVVSHDDHTPEKIQWAFDLGVEVAEFPVTLEAVAHARSHGMLTVFGTPNLVRGTSHAGNLRVADLIQKDRVDILCLDYSPMCSLLALFKVAELTGTCLTRVSRLFSLNPARSVKLDSITGSIEKGKAADLVLVDNRQPVPRVLTTFVNGRPVYQTIPCPPMA